MIDARASPVLRAAGPANDPRPCKRPRRAELLAQALIRRSASSAAIPLKGGLIPLFARKIPLFLAAAEFGPYPFNINYLRSQFVALNGARTADFAKIPLQQRLAATV